MRTLLGLLLLLLALPGAALAEEPSPPYTLIAADRLRLDGEPSAPSELTCQESLADACWSRHLALNTTEDMTAAGGVVPREGRKPRRMLGALVALGDFVVTAANATLGYDRESFHVNKEDFFGQSTADGGADKASHFVDYYIVSKELTNIYRLLDFSEREALIWGFAVATLGGVVGEVGDGFQRHGFSWEDLLMNTLGAGTATLLSATRTHDLVGFRTSHLPGPTYIHDVYSMDLKLAGVARRLGANIGPLRFLLLSATYGVKGYRDNSSPDDEERQVGIEIGLNLEEILNSVHARRDTWWGYLLHMVGDNVRFPYLAVGFRYDLNHNKWRGPNNGNYP
ncbi:MAG TPA: DUF2279 domain-containing protein [Methylomirabilota bacterium]|nr:DUF2279 domain-containing protein [Methylomirabilota bacterium]